MALIKLTLALAMLSGSVEAQAPIVELLDVECESGHFSALILQFNPVDTAKIIRVELEHAKACGTPT